MELPVILGSGLLTVVILLCVCVSTIIPMSVAGFFLYTFVSRIRIGMITPGSPAMVRFDPNDTTKVAVESLGAPFTPPQN